MKWLRFDYWNFSDRLFGLLLSVRLVRFRETLRHSNSQIIKRNCGRIPANRRTWGLCISELVSLKIENPPITSNAFQHIVLLLAFRLKWKSKKSHLVQIYASFSAGRQRQSVLYLSQFLQSSPCASSSKFKSARNSQSINQNPWRPGVVGVPRQMPSLRRPPIDACPLQRGETVLPFKTIQM